MVAYMLLRSILLATIEAPEPRYTLECFPIVIAFAAATVARVRPASVPDPSAWQLLMQRANGLIQKDKLRTEW